jgi:hypothetical protein
VLGEVGGHHRERRPGPDEPAAGERVADEARADRRARLLDAELCARQAVEREAGERHEPVAGPRCQDRLGERQQLTRVMLIDLRADDHVVGRLVVRDRRAHDARRLRLGQRAVGIDHERGVREAAERLRVAAQQRTGLDRPRDDPLRLHAGEQEVTDAHVVGRVALRMMRDGQRRRGHERLPAI